MIQYVSASPGSGNGLSLREGLFINEYMAGNRSTFTDEFGEYDDWIEIYNGNDYPVDLGGLYLSDSLEDPTKHHIPLGMSDSTTIPAKSYLILWADGQEEQGVLHLGFKLDRQAEQIGLFQVAGGMIDSLSYTFAYPDMASGRLPDGSGNLQYVSASPGSENGFNRLEGLFINEFLLKNVSADTDEFGEFDDWVEIYNENDYALSHY